MVKAQHQTMEGCKFPPKKVSFRKKLCVRALTRAPARFVCLFVFQLTKKLASLIRLFLMNYYDFLPRLSVYRLINGYCIHMDGTSQ